jgi:hypothetical protein
VPIPSNSYKRYLSWTEAVAWPLVALNCLSEAGYYQLEEQRAMLGMDYAIHQSSYRCARTGRELRPGERFYSVVYDRGGELTREDVGVEAWQGPPADAFSFWLGRVPPSEQNRRPRFDDELLLDFFQRFAGEAEPRKVSFRYILALLLMRRKRLKFEEARQDGDRELLALRCPQTRKLHLVIDPKLADQELADVQEAVHRILGTGPT